MQAQPAWSPLSSARGRVSQQAHPPRPLSGACAQDSPWPSCPPVQLRASDQAAVWWHHYLLRPLLCSLLKAHLFVDTGMFVCRHPGDPSLCGRGQGSLPGRASGRKRSSAPEPGPGLAVNHWVEVWPEHSPEHLAAVNTWLPRSEEQAGHPVPPLETLVGPSYLFWFLPMLPTCPQLPPA